MTQYFPFILLALAVLLFVLPARARKKVQAQAQALQNSLTVGTPVMTTSGLHGTVAGLGEGTVDLEIASGVVVTFARQAILEVRTPAGPAATDPSITGDDTPGAAGERPADGTV
ncbi:MAG TPA: preprotein translocase subunit YajC [Blastococcus sp.]|nr:preprotein translocase subunit YajC [Blastococcus sp.]